MNQKVAVITGASRGIGRAVALDLAREGYHLALIARSEEGLASTKEEAEKVTNGAVEVLTYPLDVSDRTAVFATIESIEQHFSRIDVLFNNAGVFHLGTSTADWDDIQAMVSVNTLGAISVLQAVVPMMKKQQSGYIFNVASNAGKNAGAAYGAYSMSKFGIVGYSQSLFRELLADHVKVTALCPSVVDTEMSAGFSYDNEEKITLDDMVNTVNYCLSLSDNARVMEIVVQCRVIALAKN